jgi:hypothetical protein
MINVSSSGLSAPHHPPPAWPACQCTSFSRSSANLRACSTSSTMSPHWFIIAARAGWTSQETVGHALQSRRTESLLNRLSGSMSARLNLVWRRWASTNEMPLANFIDVSSAQARGGRARFDSEHRAHGRRLRRSRAGSASKSGPSHIETGCQNTQDEEEGEAAHGYYPIVDSKFARDDVGSRREYVGWTATPYLSRRGRRKHAATRGPSRRTTEPGAG